MGGGLFAAAAIVPGGRTFMGGSVSASAGARLAARASRQLKSGQPLWTSHPFLSFTVGIDWAAAGAETSDRASSEIAVFMSRTAMAQRRQYRFRIVGSVPALAFAFARFSAASPLSCTLN